MPISVFDHWLNEAECSQSSVLSYAAAAKNADLAAYLDGERRFISLYSELAAEGASIIRDGDERVRLRGESRRFREAVISSLRDYRHMDLYFPSWRARLIGNWDRTDWLFLRDPGAEPAITEIVRHHGLHVLSG